MRFISHDVIEPLSQTGVIFSEPIRNHPDSPAEFLGQPPGAFARFRHVTAGTKQVSWLNHPNGSPEQPWYDSYIRQGTFHFTAGFLGGPRQIGDRVKAERHARHGRGGRW